MPHNDDDPFFPHNDFRYFADLSVAAALEANPDIVVDPVRKDDHNIAAARDAQILSDYFEKELFNPIFELESEKIRQLEGGVWWLVTWDMEAGNSLRRATAV